MSLPESTLYEKSDMQLERESNCNHPNLKTITSECGQFQDSSCSDCGYENTIDKENYQ